MRSWVLQDHDSGLANEVLFLKPAWFLLFLEGAQRTFSILPPLAIVKKLPRELLFGNQMLEDTIPI